MNAKLALPLLALAAIPFAQRSTTSGSSRQPVAPTPGSVEELQVAGGGVPRGYMILGETQIPPRGYSFAQASLVGDSWWTSTGSIPIPPGYGARIGAAAVALNDKVYLLGGGSTANLGLYSVNSVDVFDSITKTWASSVPMQMSREWFGAAELNGRIIVAGGWTYSPVPGSPFITDSVEEFDPVANTWSSLPPLSTPRSFFGAAVVNGKLYVAGGSGPGGASVEAYDPSTQTWSSVAPLITPRYQHAVAASNGKLYVFGGSTTPPTASAEEYDPLTDSWRVIASPTPRTLLAGCAHGDRVFAIGGLSSYAYTSAVPVVEEYDPIKNRWIPWLPMLGAGFGAPTASANGFVFVFGVGIVDGVTSGVQELEPGVRLFVHRKN